MRRSFVVGLVKIGLCYSMMHCSALFALEIELNSTNDHAVERKMGLIQAPGVDMIIAHCSACHSTSLIAQNSMSRNRWLETIRWMQNTQKLWPLGEAEPVILDYLSTWYGPKKEARRPPLPLHLMPKSQSQK